MSQLHHILYINSQKNFIGFASDIVNLSANIVTFDKTGDTLDIENTLTGRSADAAYSQSVSGRGTVGAPEWSADAQSLTAIVKTLPPDSTTPAKALNSHPLKTSVTS